MGNADGDCVHASDISITRVEHLPRSLLGRINEKPAGMLRLERGDGNLSRCDLDARKGG